MKLKKTIRRFDDALFRLQELHAMLGKVQTIQGAGMVAAEMEAPMNALCDLLEVLDDKVRKGIRHG